MPTRHAAAQARITAKPAPDLLKVSPTESDGSGTDEFDRVADRGDWLVTVCPTEGWNFGNLGDQGVEAVCAHLATTLTSTGRWSRDVAEKWVNTPRFRREVGAIWETSSVGNTVWDILAAHGGVDGPAAYAAGVPVPEYQRLRQTDAGRRALVAMTALLQ